MNPGERATLRFAVQGNAICMFVLSEPLLTSGTFLIQYIKVTGGAGTLALSAARALLEHGISGLGLLDLPSTFENVESKAAIVALKKDFPQVKIVTEPSDVTDSEGLTAAVQKVRDQLGPLNILVCFAGIVSCVDAEDISAEQWRRVLDVNTTGAWLAAQAVGK